MSKSPPQHAKFMRFFPPETKAMTALSRLSTCSAMRDLHLLTYDSTQIALIAAAVIGSCSLQAMPAMP
jgi:hypothetical protein